MIENNELSKSAILFGCSSDIVDSSIVLLPNEADIIMRWKDNPNEYLKQWRKNNQDKSKQYRKKWVNKIRIKEPWRTVYLSIKSRCHPSGQYFPKGRKNFLTLENVKYLWDRDKADLLKRPSIDRINNKGHYTLDNCRFIELSENIRREQETGKNFNRKEWSKQYYQKNIEHIRKRYNEWRVKNKDKINARKREWERKRKKV